MSLVDLGCEMVYPPESLIIFEASEEASSRRDCSIMHAASPVSLTSVDRTYCGLILLSHWTHRSALTIAFRSFNWLCALSASQMRRASR